MNYEVEDKVNKAPQTLRMRSASSTWAAFTS